MASPGLHMSQHRGAWRNQARIDGPCRSRYARCRDSLCGLLLQVGLPLAEGSEAVHVRAVRKRALRRSDVVEFARPCLLRRGLQGAAVREGELPGGAADLVDGIEMG